MAINRPNSLLSLGELQQKILIHLFERCNDVITGTYLAKEFKVKQPTIAKSVRALSKSRYVNIEKIESAINGEKSLRLTDKGAAAAIIIGAAFSDLSYLSKSYNIDHHDNQVVRFVKKLVPDHLYYNRISYIRAGIKYLFEVSFFDDKGELDAIIDYGYHYSINDHLVDKIILRIELEYSLYIREHISIGKFVSKYNINKDVLIHHLDSHRAYIDSLIADIKSS